MDHKREIINDIQSIAGRYSPYEVFSDWIRSAALAIQNSKLSLIGCRAIVVQGDTLITPFDPAKTDRGDNGVADRHANHDGLEAAGAQ